MTHKYKVGDLVVPKIGPHKGHPHAVIHVHNSGHVNIQPKNIHPSKNRYRLGAATAHPEDLTPHTVSEVRTEEVEQIDEISKETKSNYLKKAPQTIKPLEKQSELDAERKRVEPYQPSWRLRIANWNRKIANRKAGIEKATASLSKEEVEQIDELSKKTLGSYVSKAIQSKEKAMVGRHTANFKNQMHIIKTGRENPELSASSDSHGKTEEKRKVGIERAISRLSK